MSQRNEEMQDIVLKKYNDNKKIIQKCIYQNIYRAMEKNIANKVTPFLDINFLKKINNKEHRAIIVNYIKKIYNSYNDYLYAILFNYYGMDGLDSGEHRNVNDFESNYILDKLYHCHSTNSEIFKILYKYVDQFKNDETI